MVPHVQMAEKHFACLRVNKYRCMLHSRQPPCIGTSQNSNHKYQICSFKRVAVKAFFWAWNLLFPAVPSGFQVQLKDDEFPKRLPWDCQYFKESRLWWSCGYRWKPKKSRESLSCELRWRLHCLIPKGTLTTQCSHNEEQVLKLNSNLSLKNNNGKIEMKCHAIIWNELPLTVWLWV